MKTRLRIVTGKLLEPSGKEDILDQQYVAAQDALELEAELLPICEHHRNGELEWPDLTSADDACAVCRIAYLEWQEGLLEEWQQRAQRAEESLAEVQRPLDAQMGRLNATITQLNGELSQLRAAFQEKAMTNSALSRNGEIFKLIADQFPAETPPEDYQFEFNFDVKLDFRDWRLVLKALFAADGRGACEWEKK